MIIVKTNHNTQTGHIDSAFYLGADKGVFCQLVSGDYNWDKAGSSGGNAFSSFLVTKRLWSSLFAFR